ncbi:MAG: bifunctional homocysteine S-methyltransferase/methylenetetrahydrofolate reductase [Candidatus Eremiobacteraeota bacterium]|nr:bifunctional homocysteine S-methyltransferase/methylenetetrahydrofolate reductase [Candidatus Eremiobacteraeota bacterium]MBC5827267.1 bifunctional homocysteine S-methyltransferase/methylenetetrahydrofolate reductase [Candidatus Eremiobacteraeota bacterium]
METIQSRVRDEVLLADGAMGTLLFARGADVMSCVELLNVENPAAVERVHRDYIAAGAQLLKTNSFAANRLKLAAHELKNKLDDLNSAAVVLARRAAGKQAYVAGSIGPLGALMRPLGSVSADEARDVFRQHIAAVAAAGPDLLLLETFGSIEEALLGLAAAKDVAPHLFVMVSLSIVEDGKTPAGDPPLSAFHRLIDAGADGVGINCAVGPQTVYDALAPAVGLVDCPISVMPNAGYPEQVDGRTVYATSPTYFQRYARDFVAIGASIIGGCCGTTPAHIAAMADEVCGKPRRRTPPTQESTEPMVRGGAGTGRAVIPGQVTPRTRPLPRHAQRVQTAFERKLGREFVITAELSPPRGVDYEPSLAVAHLLEAAGVEAVNIPDNPTARLRMSSTALGHLIARDTGLTAILHFTCRDRNLLGLQSDLLGASALGISAILALTGDPSNVGDFPKATSVFDVTSAGLTEIINSLNHGKDHAGNSIGEPTHFRIGVTVNPVARDVALEFQKLKEKISAGADFAMTQPVYDIATAVPLLERAHAIGFPILVGVLPLQSYRNAEYLHNEVPGMAIPMSVRQRLKAAANPAHEGMAIARDLLIELTGTESAAGAYVIAQDRYEVAAQVVDAARAASRRTASLAQSV